MQRYRAFLMTATVLLTSIGTARAQVFEHFTVVRGPVPFSACGGYGFDSHCCGDFGGFVPVYAPVFYAPLPPPSWPVVSAPSAVFPAPVWQGQQLAGQSVNVVPGISEPLPTPSTTTSKLQSLRLEAKGDHWFRKQEYSTAYVRYRDAVREAPDRGAAHVRLALALAAIGQYERAAEQLKTGLRNDPQLPEASATLDDLFGEDNVIAKKSLVIGVTDWAKEDANDPNRLFLVGTLLALDGQADKAAELLTAGRKFAGEGEHFRAMLDFLGEKLPEFDPAAVQPEPVEVGPSLPPLPSLLAPLRKS